MGGWAERGAQTYELVTCIPTYSRFYNCFTSFISYNIEQLLNVTSKIMNLNSVFHSLLFLLLPRYQANATAHLNVTVVTASNNISTLECWQLSTPFLRSTQSGTAGSIVLQLGSLANASFSIIPAGTNGGPHNAPAVQCVSL